MNDLTEVTEVTDEAVPEVDEVVTEVNDLPEVPHEADEVETPSVKPLPSPSTTRRLSPLWEPKRISLFSQRCTTTRRSRAVCGIKQ